MKYLFEDKHDDLLSILFRASYPNEVIDNFIYCNGNGEVIDTTNRILANSEEMVACYLDAVPGNFHIRNIYKELRRISIKNNYRVIVFPIICSEYYFIKSLIDYTNYFDTANKDIKICINKGNFTESDIYRDPIKGKICRNFEKFCKIILMNATMDCIKHSRGEDGSNKQYGSYYSKDCLCSLNSIKCKEMSLAEKSANLLSEYYCVPAGSIMTIKNMLNTVDMWKVHRKLVDEFNSFSDSYVLANVYNGSIHGCKINDQYFNLMYIK